MAKNKKRKKAQDTQGPHWNNTYSTKIPKEYLEVCYAAARRIFVLAGENPEAFDTFPKRRKQEIFRTLILSPHIQAMPGHKVPARYIHYVEQKLNSFLRSTYFDKEVGVTWMELAMIGETIFTMFRVGWFVNSLPEPQRELVDRMNKTFKELQLSHQAKDMITKHVKTLLIKLSQPNFRIYGMDERRQPIRKVANRALQPVILITVHECQSLRFRYRNKDRKAFLVAIGQCSEQPFQGATIALSRIFPDTKNDRELNIYIQSHAIHRFKERIDTFEPTLRNLIFVPSLMDVQRVVQGAGGAHLIACVSHTRNGTHTIGYFAFTIDGDNLLVLTLLPLLSRDTPEGHVLHERLRLSTNDLKYLGMDKLSFFYQVDIEQIPMLKKVLFDELHLDYIRRVHSSYHSKTDPYDEKKTLFVKNFFEKLKEQPADHTEVFDDLADLDM
jgi:hypothetical protein